MAVINEHTGDHFIYLSDENGMVLSMNHRGELKWGAEGRKRLLAMSLRNDMARAVRLVFEAGAEYFSQKLLHVQEYPEVLILETPDGPAAIISVHPECEKRLLAMLQVEDDSVTESAKDAARHFLRYLQRTEANRSVGTNDK